MRLSRNFTVLQCLCFSSAVPSGNEKINIYWRDLQSERQSRRLHEYTTENWNVNVFFQHRFEELYPTNCMGMVSFTKSLNHLLSFSNYLTVTLWGSNQWAGNTFVGCKLSRGFIWVDVGSKILSTFWSSNTPKYVCMIGMYTWKINEYFTFCATLWICWIGWIMDRSSNRSCLSCIFFMNGQSQEMLGRDSSILVTI